MKAKDERPKANCTEETAVYLWFHYADESFLMDGRARLTPLFAQWRHRPNHVVRTRSFQEFWVRSCIHQNLKLSLAWVLPSNWSRRGIHAWIEDDSIIPAKIRLPSLTHQTGDQSGKKDSVVRLPAVVAFSLQTSFLSEVEIVFFS